ncbi:CbtA family protein [Amycolatopsis endophytica]|uniref:Putative cobalt transporter CbtA n=2 Tax=Amycolatopsis endophytica TaxID=860233 RepID=A0A853B5A0_9PSEU|nr:putative cobalt transporter CbtA [Amycolatopsis endophytica]
MRALLVRGMLAGLIAAVLAALFAYAVGEPPVNAAIGLEEAAAHASGEHSHEEELVSRGVQSTLGLLTAVGVYGIAIGGLLAIAFALVYGRLGSLRPGPTATLLTGAAFVVVVLVPFLKYPANPPAVGQPDTIGERTGLYFGFIALSLAFAVAAAAAGRQVALRSGAAAGAIAGGAVYLVPAALTARLMPVINEVPEDFPATTLWDFRIASLGTQVVLWTVLGVTFGLLARRALTAPAAGPPVSLAR